MPICEALLKYGYSGFSLEILVYCDSSEVLEREDHFLNLLNPEYNNAKYASAPFLGRKHSEKSRAQISAFRKGKYKGFEIRCLVKLNQWLRPETRAKISAAMFGITRSEETLCKLSALNKGTKHPLFGKTRSVASPCNNF
jgi:group I intron endonuclease